MNKNYFEEGNNKQNKKTEYTLETEKNSNKIYQKMGVTRKEEKYKKTEIKQN